MTEEEKEQFKRVEWMAQEMYGLPTEDVEFVLNLVKRMDAQIDMMSDKVTTDYHDKEWVKKFYIEKAKESQYENKETKTI